MVSGASAKVGAGVDCTLRAKARAFIEAGKVVRPLPNRRWGGPGTGDSCAFCGAAVEPHETDIEVEDPRIGPGGGNVQHFHVACLSAIEAALRELEMKRQAISYSSTSQAGTDFEPDEGQRSA